MLDDGMELSWEDLRLAIEGGQTEFEVCKQPLIRVAFKEVASEGSSDVGTLGTTKEFVAKELRLVMDLCVQGTRTEFETKEYVDKSDVYPLPQRFQVTVASAANLRNADWSLLPGKGVSDPYVVLTRGGKCEFKTDEVRDSLNPTWNFVKTIEGVADGENFELSVWDKDSCKADDPLGKCTLSNDKFNRTPFEESVELTGKGAKGNQQDATPTLTLKVREEPIEIKTRISAVVDLKKTRGDRAVVTVTPVGSPETDAAGSALKALLCKPVWFNSVLEEPLRHRIHEHFVAKMRS